MRLISLDTETTGLSPAKNHRIVEIGCVELISGRRTTSIYHSYINPNRSISAEVVKILGRDETFYRDYPRFESILDEFLDFIGDDTLLIHNAPFDLGFLNAELARFKKPALNNPVIDSLLLAREKFPNQANSLDALCKRFKIDLSARVHHGALLDAGLLAEVYIALTSANQTSFSWQGDRAKGDKRESPAAATATTTAQPAPRAPAPAQRKKEASARLSPAEAQAHQELVGLLKKPLWDEF